MFQKEINLHKSDSKQKIIIDVQQKLKRHVSHTSKPKNQIKIPQQTLIINLANNENKETPVTVKSKSPKNSASKLMNIQNYDTQVRKTIIIPNTNLKNSITNKAMIKPDLSSNSNIMNNIKKNIMMNKTQKLNTSLKKNVSKKSYQEKTQSKKTYNPLNLNEKYEKIKNKLRNTSCGNNCAKISIDKNSNNTKSNTIKKNKGNSKVKKNSTKKSVHVIPASVDRNKYKNKPISKDKKNNKCMNKNSKNNINVSNSNNNITINKNNTININNYVSSKNNRNDIECMYSTMENNILSEKYLNAQNKFRKNYFASIIQKIFRGYLFRKTFVKLSKRKSIIIELGKSRSKSIKTYNNKINNSISTDIMQNTVYVKKRVLDTCLPNKKIKNIFISSPKIARKISYIEEMNINICPSPKKIEEIVINRRKSNIYSHRNKIQLKPKTNIFNNTINNFSIYNSDRQVIKDYGRYYLLDAINYWYEIAIKRKIIEKLIEKYNKIGNINRIFLNKTFTQKMHSKNIEVNNSFYGCAIKRNNIFLNEMEQKNYRLLVHSRSSGNTKKDLEF